LIYQSADQVKKILGTGGRAGAADDIAYCLAGCGGSGFIQYKRGVRGIGLRYGA
jgi:hypothetical protein